MPKIDFNKQKASYIKNLEKAKAKGLVDEDIVELIDLINSKSEFFTTSSCSGRINLLKVPESRKKHESKWIFKSHSCIKYEDIKFITDKNYVKNNFSEFHGIVYFKLEGLIFHIVAKTIESAQKLLDIANEVGLKRSGIRATRKRLVVEIDDVECINLPIIMNTNLLITDNYLKELVDIANEGLRRVKKKRDRLLSIFKQI